MSGDTLIHKTPYPAIVESRRQALTVTSTSHYSPNMLLSGSRDKTLIIWNLTRDETQYGYPKRSLHGHSHMVSDCVRPPLPPRWL